ncbi:Hypothetical_protein [Hexamita inflata]|uniref:Hypothetical_protein n=1 Tax=Hexamita inflata TaxID=28002 RepID=A0ABP1J601_9EUKA
MQLGQTQWHSISEVAPKQKYGSQMENNFLLYKCSHSSCKQIMHDTKGIEQHLQRAMKSTNTLTKEAHTVKDVYTPQFYVLHCNSKVIDDTWLKYHTNTANLPPTRFTPMNTRVPDVIVDDTCIKQDCTMKPETLRILTDTQFTEKITYSLNEIANQPTTEFFKRKLKFIMNQCNNELSLNTLRRILQSFRSCHFFKNKKKKNKPKHDKKPGLSSLDLDRAVQLVQYNKNISKTYNFLTRKLDCPKQLSEEEITGQMDKLFPQPQYVKIPNCVAPQGISNPHFKPEEINRAIMSLKSSKESGPDGINHVLLKRAAASNPKILDLLSNCWVMARLKALKFQRYVIGHYHLLLHRDGSQKQSSTPAMVIMQRQLGEPHTLGAGGSNCDRFQARNVAAKTSGKASHAKLKLER